MTNAEFESVERVTLLTMMENDLRYIQPGDGIPEEEYNRMASTLRTWKMIIKNSIEIRKQRADAGKART